MHNEKQDVERLRGRRRDADCCCRARRPRRSRRPRSRCRGSRAFSTCPRTSWKSNKLIEKHAASLGVPGVTTKWINSERRRRADRCAAGRQRRHPQHRDRQSAAAVGSHPRRRQGHRRHLGAADDADQPRRQYQVDQGFRPERQDRGADRQGLDAGDRAADRGRRSLRRRPVVEARCQHRAARPSRRLCGADQPAARGAQSLLDPAVHVPRTEERARRACGADRRPT